MALGEQENYARGSGNQRHCYTENESSRSSREPMCNSICHENSVKIEIQNRE